MSDHGDRKHVYTPLYGRDIRLLELSPSISADAPIHVKLCITPLVERAGPTVRHPPGPNGPYYEALSYVWGASDEHRTITLQGPPHGSVGSSVPSWPLFDSSLRGATMILPVTDNLSRALRRLRKRYKKRVMWIDAICIDQANFRERSQQVSLMKDIYRNASQVNIWLGDADSSFNAGIQLANALESTTYLWTERAWIHQEFLLNNNRVLCWGTKKLSQSSKESAPWSLANKITDMMVNTDFTEHSQLSTIKTFRHSLLRYCDLMKHRSDPFFGILDLTLAISGANATDPRDAVYSLLGLMLEPDRRDIDVDYEADCADVYAQATWSSICNESMIASRYDRFEGASYSLRVLELVRRSKHPRMPGLSSWAIDFTASHAEIPSRTGSDTVHWPGSQEAAQTGAEFRQRTLVLEGVQLGTIRHVSRGVPTYAPNAAVHSHGSKQSANTAEYARSGAGQVLEVASQDLDLANAQSGTSRPPTLDSHPAMQLIRCLHDCATSSREQRFDDLLTATYREKLVDYGLPWFRDFNIPGWRVLFAVTMDVPFRFDNTPPIGLWDWVSSWWPWATSSQVDSTLAARPEGWICGVALGEARCQVEKGDCVVLFPGCTLPFILRPTANCTYTLCGVAWLHGLDHDLQHKVWSFEGYERDFTIV